MIQLICFIAPSFLATEILQHKQGEKFDGRKYFSTLAIFSGIINMLTMAMVSIVLKHPEYVVTQYLFSTNFTFKYLLAGFVLAVLLPVAYEFCRNNIRVEFTVDTTSKKGLDE